VRSITRGVIDRTRARISASDGHNCVRTQNVRSSAHTLELAKTCEM
jgi:hypothetical protein